MLYCWHCGWKRYEFTGLKKLWEDKARCFYCRMDALDAKYGPSMTATELKNMSKNKQYWHPRLITNYQFLRIKYLIWRLKV
jgi:hypothetical protein